MSKPILLLLIICLVCSLTTSCGVYSFTGATVSSDIKTISVGYFINRSGAGPANLSQTFTEKVKDYYQRNGNLSLSPNQGDLQVEGNITGYNLQPVAPTGQELAGRTRLTMTVQVRFRNQKDEKQNFDTPFSAYRDFAQNQTISQVEIGLVDEITDQIVLDMFNKTVANW